MRKTSLSFGINFRSLIWQQISRTLFFNDIQKHNNLKNHYLRKKQEKYSFWVYLAAD